jgi:uncharacterized protein YjdB
MKKIFYSILIGAATVFALSACSETEPETGSKDIKGLSFANPTVELFVGETVDMGLVITPSGANTSQLICESSDPATATTDGRYVTGVKAGPAKIKVSASKDGGETVTAPATSGNFTAATANAANTSGVALQSVTITPNNTIEDQTAVEMSWKGSSSNKVVSLAFVQKAHVIGLGADALAAGTTLKLTSTASAIDWNLVTLTIQKNGVDLAEGTDFTVSGATVTLTTAAVEGDTYAITATGGNAPEETITVKCK